MGSLLESGAVILPNTYTEPQGVTCIIEMASEIAREESFRTALRNQKRRLSATERKPSIPDLGLNKTTLGMIKNRDSLTPPRRNGLTPPRSNFTPPRRAVDDDQASNGTSKQSTPDIRLEFWDIDELSPLSTPARSPPRSPSPYGLNPRSPSRSPSPRPIHSPVPRDSPLLHPHSASPALKRAKSFNKELRRARSFRTAREKSASRNNSAVNSRSGSPCRDGDDDDVTPGQKQEVSFSIKRALGSRKGWKIMADDGHSIDGSALKTVVSMIKDMEFQGFAVPERISIKIP